jgi:hypothetical protein
VVAAWWIPAAASVAALVVFGSVLASTPPGFYSLVLLFQLGRRDYGALSSSYAVGAAATLALVVLVVLASACVLVTAGWRWLRPRSR